MKIITLLLICILSVLFNIQNQALAQTGKVLYEQKCSRCHTAYKPTDFAAEDWPDLVRSMKAQAALNQEQMDTIVEHLVSESGQVQSADLTSGPTLGGYLYTEYFDPETKRRRNFDLHYLAVSVSGWATENISYIGEFEFEHGGTGGSNAFVEQAYMDYWLLPNIGVKMGAMLTPFNRFDEFHDPLTNQLITRPQISREIGVSAWKDVGVDLHGFFRMSDQNSVLFDLYTINGLGSGSRLRESRQYRDNNENRAVGARVNLVFRDVLEVGGSGYQGAWDDNSDYNLTLTGAHLMFKSEYADIYGEYSIATSENPSGFEDGEMSGYFVQATRLFKRRYRPTVRYGALDYLDEGALLGRTATDKKLTELALGLAYYPASRVVFKAEYTIFTQGDRVVAADYNQLGLQAAVKF